MEKKITDIHGRTTTIQSKETYTVIYTVDGDRKIMNNLYLNYPGNNHIGHDGEDGDGPWDARIYFDGTDHDDNKKVERVFTTQEWEQIIDKIVMV